MSNVTAGNITRRRSAMRVSRSALTAGAAVAVAGFTIVEMLLVVAIIALMTIGVAQVFRVTGETVKVGKRLSNLTASAALIEKQFRFDFAAMTREGFMVMRHRTAGGVAPFADQPIALAPGDPNLRTRRVDELVFFITGDFTSKRDPVYPSRQATSTQARVYFGHGHRKNPTSATFYDPPALDDLNNTADTPKFGQPGPNQYASDWILLRHLTLLCQPSIVVKERLPNGLDDPNPVYSGGDPNTSNAEDLDSNVQIDLQPACPSIFRYINSFEPWNGDSRFNNGNLVRDETPERPQFASGLLDIATTDLTEIRSILLDAQPMNARAPGLSFFTLIDDFVAGPVDDPEVGSYFRADAPPPRRPDVPNSTTRLMQRWMRQALPANSDAGERMRCEPRPPDFLGVLGSTGGTGYTKEYQRTDQAMLAAHNFVVGCSEFIVEWSFGKAYRANDPQGRGGQLIWHGMNRPAGVTPTGQPAYAALQYGDPLNAGEDWYRMPYRRKDGTTGLWPLLEVGGQPLNVHVVTEINGFANIPIYSYFGYIDPTYRLRSVWTDGGDGAQRNGRADAPTEIFDDLDGNFARDTGPIPGDPNDDGEPIAGNGDIWFDPPSANNAASSTEKPDPREPSSIPWPWPKLVRITMSIVDPTDPMREQTFQFIVEVPEGLNNAQF